jgi:hypothetical protein
LTRNERKTLEVILSQNEPGFDVLQTQLDGLTVSGKCEQCGEGDHCPSIRLSPDKTKGQQSTASGPILGGHGWRVPPGPPPPDKPAGDEPVFYTIWVQDGWLDYLEVSHVGDSLPEMPPAWTIDPNS